MSSRLRSTVDEQHIFRNLPKKKLTQAMKILPMQILPPAPCGMERSFPFYLTSSKMNDVCRAKASNALESNQDPSNAHVQTRSKKSTKFPILVRGLVQISQGNKRKSQSRRYVRKLQRKIAERIEGMSLRH